MRTTINVRDELFRRIRKLAAESGTTVTAVVEEALQEMLARRKRQPKPERVDLTTFGRKGLQPGVDLDDSASLLDLTEPPGVPRRR